MANPFDNKLKEDYDPNDIKMESFKSQTDSALTERRILIITNTINLYKNNKYRYIQDTKPANPTNNFIFFQIENN